MNSFEENFRQMIRAELGSDLTAIWAELQAIREEIRAGTPPELRGMLTIDQVAEFMKVHPQTARKWLHENRVKLHKAGTATRVMGSDVHEKLTEKKRRPSAAKTG